jgi:hypothetical protein
MADVVKQLDRAINQLEAQAAKHGGKVPALAATGDSLDHVPIGGRARARGVRIPNVKITLKKKSKGGGKKRHAPKTTKTARTAAAKKGARTRKANHLQKVRAGKKGAKVALKNKAKRSASARKAARTRAGK